MTIKTITIAILLFCISLGAIYAQDYTISGQLSDAANGEDLPFATVSVNGKKAIGTSSNVYGFYSLTLPKGDYVVLYQYVGYKTITKNVKLTENKKVDVELSDAASTLAEVVVSAERADGNISRNDVGVTKIDMKDIANIPTFGGEPDVMRIIQMNPGIKTAGEGNSGFYVRGGGLDQNLILLDEAPVYNPSHLLGFFSVFNGDALKSATVYKGGMMPEYGGRTASVIDIRMKDGNAKKFGVSGGIGLIASRLTVEGPIVKDKGSFMVSGRRTYADLFLKLSPDESINQAILYFYDLNLKANYKVTDKDKIYLSGYFGRDKFGFGDDFGLNWGNATGTFRWNHVFTSKLFSNTSVIYSDYDYEFGFGQDDNKIALQSVVKDINVKQDFSYFTNNSNAIKFGINVIHHTIEPGNFTAGKNTGLTSNESEHRKGIESAVYIQNEQKVNARFALNYGIRYSLYNQIGNGTQYAFDEDGELLSSEKFGNNKLMQTYGGFEPRLAANYLLNETSSLKLGYNRNFQYLHLLTSSTSSTPTDNWILSSNNIKPQIADQLSMGYFRNFKDNMFETSLEVYYKKMQNVIDYRTGANVFLNESLEGGLVYGDGKAYGAELTVKKTKGRFTGWLGYTLSRTLHQFDEINSGGWFSARQDRIHDISLVAMYAITPKLKVSANFVYYTGDAVTYPTGRYEVDGKIVPLYSKRNEERMPDYHRLDLGLVWQTKKTKKFESSWSFSIYNVYARENAYSITFSPAEPDPEKPDVKVEPGTTQAVQLSLFKIIPSFTYNFKF